MAHTGSFLDGLRAGALWLGRWWWWIAVAGHVDLFHDASFQ